MRTWGKNLFKDPHQLRIDQEGNIWVADFGLHIVQKFTTEGKLLQTLGVRGKSGEDETHFNMPTDMAITPTGEIFVSDGYGNRRIVHFDKGRLASQTGRGSWCTLHCSGLEMQFVRRRYLWRAGTKVCPDHSPPAETT